MDFDVSLRIENTTNGFGTDINLWLEVEQAPSGFYIAKSRESPLIASGVSPVMAILEYLSNFHFSKTTEAEGIEQ